MLTTKQVDEIARRYVREYIPTTKFLVRWSLFLSRRPMSVVVSCHRQWNLDTLLERLWEELEMVRVYTKKRGEFPDFSDPLVLTPQRGEQKTNIHY